MAEVLDESPEEAKEEERQAVRAALQQIMSAGQEELTKSPRVFQDNVDTLTYAMYRALTQPESEVRLTYKTVEQATCAWTWVVAACKERGDMDAKKSSALNIELKNGSALVFKTEKGNDRDDRGV
jgi:hypothetical protein